VDPISEVEKALGAELLQCRLLPHWYPERPKIGGRYIVEEVLGRGASGLVVAALDYVLNRPVALKIRPVQGDVAMLSEARTLASLDHPNVVRVYDVGIEPAVINRRQFKLWFVSMERVDGRTMRAWLQEKVRTPGEILAVCVDVARGLAAAHEARIVHRDVKPDNVLIRADGRAQILDFGLAVQATSTQSEAGGLRTAAGTDPYMAPEARLGKTSRKSDQYALGITLVEALTGDPRPAGRRVPRGVPRAAWVIAQRATATDPEDRYPDMKAMVDALRCASRGATSSRWASIVAAVGIGFVALVIGGLLMGNIGGLLVGNIARRRDAPAASPTALAGVPAPAESRDAGVDAGRAEAEAAARGPEWDAGVDAGRAEAEAAARGPEWDAGSMPDAARRPHAGGCRLPAGGRRVFHTVRTYGGVPGRAARGTYVLGLDVDARRRVLRGVSIVRTAPRRDMLEVRSFAFDERCELHVIALAEHRRYEFWLAVDGDRVSGRFEATRDPAQGDFGGIVEPATGR
jgi:F0F1-type ATP synthase membrane subunit c/vacuolar-type H+-ATPase subunit K